MENRCAAAPVERRADRARPDWTMTSWRNRDRISLTSSSIEIGVTWPLGPPGGRGVSRSMGFQRSESDTERPTPFYQPGPEKNTQSEGRKEGGRQVRGRDARARSRRLSVRFLADLRAGRTRPLCLRRPPQLDLVVLCRRRQAQGRRHDFPVTCRPSSLPKPTRKPPPYRLAEDRSQPRCV